MSTSKSCELCNHRFTFTTEHKLKPFKKWEYEIGTECGDLLRESVAFGVVIVLTTVILYEMDKARARGILDNPLLLGISVMFLVMLVLMMLILMCSMCCNSITILRKWRAHNSVLAVHEDTPV